MKYLISTRTTNGANARTHWRVRAKKAKSERAMAAWELTQNRPPLLPARITLTRIAPRSLDAHDGLPISFKHIVDGIADAYGVRDNTPLIEWRYAQRRGEPRQYAVEIEIETVGRQ